MTVLRENIDAAAANLGTKAELARALGVSPQTLNAWRSGAEPCPIDAVGAIAAYAGKSATEAITDAALARAKRKPFAGFLERALGKSHVGVLAIFVGSVVAAASSLAPTMYRPVK
jgi:DNA-binding transcriptional regulator YdaS (Cro superfamily)